MASETYCAQSVVASFLTRQSGARAVQRVGQAKLAKAEFASIAPPTSGRPKLIGIPKVLRAGTEVPTNQLVAERILLPKSLFARPLDVRAQGTRGLHLSVFVPGPTSRKRDSTMT